MSVQAGPRPSAAADTPRLGLWIFLASEVLFFGAVFVAYGYARARAPAGFAEAGRHTNAMIGTLNTALLITSSATIAAAAALAKRAAPRRWIVGLLWLTVALGAAFLAFKGVEWWMEWREQLVPGPRFPLAQDGAEMFFWLYFFATGLHALHLLAGLATVAGLAWMLQRLPWRPADPALDLAALYWHFVDVVWIFLYPLIYLLGRNSP